MQVRRAVPGDQASCDEIYRLAFAPSIAELHLVLALRARCSELLEFALVDNDQILACICYSPAFRDGEVVGYHLAPVAVRPDMQGKGYGSHLIGTTLRSEEVVARPVFVLGDPGFYQRFGFRTQGPVRCPYDPSGAHFGCLRWNDEGFEVGYHEAFSALP